MFKPVTPKVNFAELEEGLITYWKENKTFEKSVDHRPAEKTWTFLDGPPFVTGLPHYGSLLSSLPKDVFPRFWTMKGYRVPRVWGWDGHGLPAENKVETKLGLQSKRDIEEKIGVKKFIDECKAYVNEVSGEWEWYVDHIGRWVDFDHAYRTWDLPYMESVMWVFKQLYEKNLIYKGLRVSLYCPHDGTPISNFEVAMDADNYKEVVDPGTTYKYELVGEEKTFILAWSTTPWNKIVTPALAVNPEFTYVKVKQNGEYYILAETTMGALSAEYEIVEKMSGKNLIGKKYVPHYEYYKDKITPDEKAFQIIGGEFVTADEGTGVVTIAAYGEEDLAVMQKEHVHIEMHVEDDGMIRSDVPKFGGMYYLKANAAVEEDLQQRGLIYKTENYTHKVAMCWRCHTRLYYAPQNAWYVDIQSMKKQLAASNEYVNWIPKHFKHGRFLKSLENAPDWNISRSRYWGSPVPVWECECGERFIPGSIKELEEKSGRKITDLHKPEIDEITVKCMKCGKEMHRVPEVLDSWIEAGSASLAERHYPFGKETDVEAFYPPDFIGEYTGQIRAWFYVLHVIANGLQLRKEGENVLARNVLVEGVILGDDGRKMSKNFKNYPDPKEMLQKYGGDALRLYLLGSPVMNGEDILISEEQYRNQVKGTMLVLWNVYNFFITYANIDGFVPTISEQKEATQSGNALDTWILSLLNRLVRDETEALDRFDTISAVKQVEDFVNQFSTWYIRRSRDRIGPSVPDGDDKQAFYHTCYNVLTTLSQLMAPLTPFITDAIYRNLTGSESVHLTDWPSVDEKRVDTDFEIQMLHARKVVEVGHSLRKELQLKLRQPLSRMAFSIADKVTDKGVLGQLLEELNVKLLVSGNSVDAFMKEKGVQSKELDGVWVWLDTTITPELQAEGEARDIVRKIQEERKKLGTEMHEHVTVTLPSWPESFADYIKLHALIDTLTKGEQITVTKQ